MANVEKTRKNRKVLRMCFTKAANELDEHIKTVPLVFSDVEIAWECLKPKWDNFLVGGDGKIYEGAGWHKVGAHTRGYNRKSLGLALIGNFTDEVPSDKQLKAASDFLECGVELGELDENYKLLGARQVSSTISPGLRLYRIIKDWTHWAKTP